MRNYERPVVLVNEDLAEGVYAASGVVADSGSVSSSGAAVVSGVELTAAGNEYYKVNTYSVKIENPGNTELTDWSANISVASGTASEAKTYNTWLANVSLNGSTITITPGDGGTIPAGGTITVEVIVSYSSDSITVN